MEVVTLTTVLTPIVIYLLVPILGIALFFFATKTLKPKERKEIFILKLLIVFACLGGLLLLLLTTVFWKWSGLASVGSVFLIFIAPILMAVIGYDSFKKRANEAESTLFKLSISYFIALPLIILIAFILDR